MNPLLAILEIGDYSLIALLAFGASVCAAVMTRQQLNLRRVERKLDALLQHQGVALPSRLSPEVQRLAADPRQKIAAIKLHREQNPELGLAEAKEQVEDFAAGR